MYNYKYYCKIIALNKGKLTIKNVISIKKILEKKNIYFKFIRFPNTQKNYLKIYPKNLIMEIFLKFFDSKLFKIIDSKISFKIKVLYNMKLLI